MDMADLDIAAASAAASASSLAVFAAGAGAQTMGQVGPCLTVGMGEVATVAALNTWGATRDSELIQLRLLVVARDRELVQLKGDLGATQTVVASAFEQAKDALQAIVGNFRVEAEKLRYDGQVEAAQSLSRLELVVGEARARFDSQDALVANGLRELAQRLQAVDAWAQAEPARVAALVQAAPTQQRWRRSPGGTTLQQEPPPVPSTPPRAQDGWATYQSPTAPPMPDPWAAAAGRTATAPEQPGGPRHHNMNTPGGGGGKGGFPGVLDATGNSLGGKGGYPREMRINARDWGDSRKLDVTTSFDGFQVWKDRATMFLSKERPDVRALLTWAETQSKDDLEANLGEHAARFGVVDLAAAEYAIHDGIKCIVLDSLLGRARNCVERGCELWRSLCAEWSGAGPQVKHGKARRYQEPTRCKDTTELWTKLPAWERLGEEVMLSDLVLPEWMRCSALEKLLPAQLLGTLVARPELSTYSARLAWVKTQMEHARGLAQAAAYGPGTGKDSSGDVYMNSLEAPPGMAYSEPSDGLAWALAAAVQQGDWAQAESLQVAIFALKGGKGGYRKGLGKGKPGPGAASPAAAPKGGQQFNGVCNHCGIWGHRRSECRRLDLEMGKKGGAKGDKGAGKGGKGGPKGGKGPPADPLMECAAAEEGDWANELAGDGDYAGEEWLFDSTIASLAPWVQAPARRGRRGARGAHGAGSGAPTPVQNKFSALNLLTDDAEVLLGAVSGETRGGRVVEAVVDSGAVHSVTPPGLFPGRVCPSPWSRAGRGYRAANGTGIKNLGQVQVPFGTAEGHKCQIPFQVAEVEQPLLSVAHLTSAGNLVELGHTDGRVISLSTGRSIALERRGGVYILKMFIADAAAPLPFRRQGA